MRIGMDTFFELLETHDLGAMFLWHGSEPLAPDSVLYRGADGSLAVV